jgi:hypothetical protein
LENRRGRPSTVSNDQEIGTSTTASGEGEQEASSQAVLLGTKKAGGLQPDTGKEIAHMIHDSIVQVQPQRHSQQPPLTKWQELQSLQLTADFVRRHGITDMLTVSAVSYYMRELVALNAVEDFEQALRQIRGAV